MDNTDLNQNVDTLFRSLENFTQNEGLIGKPVSQGDKTFLPIVSVTIGYGGGNAKMGKNASTGAGAGSSTAGSGGASGTGALGLGAKLSTDGIIVIDKDNVSMLPMSGASTGQLMDKIPQIISTLSQNKQQSPQAQGQSQAPASGVAGV